jgi:fluoroacetyl-CoA thioesterase
MARDARAPSHRRTFMQPTLCVGLTHDFSHVITSDKTVPHVYPESDLFRAMPPVFATAYLVGLLEWACMEAMRAHLDPGEQSVGVDIRVSHSAATPPGFTVKVSVRVERVEGRRISFHVEAHDGVEVIGQGSHDRVVIQPERFLSKLEQKRAAHIGTT